MMDMKALKDMLCKELKQYEARTKLNLADLDAVHKLTDTIKNIDKIEMLEDDGEMDEYSEARYSRRGGYAYDDGGNSYARRGRHYVRGHYSRDGGMYSQDGYSRDGNTDRAVEILRDMMEDASPEEQKTIERMLQAARK